MISTIRAMARLCIAVIALAVFLPIAPSHAQTTFISGSGSDSNTCTTTHPCASLSRALTELGPNGQVNCLDSTGDVESGITINIAPLTIDCTGVLVSLAANNPALLLNGPGTVIIKNLTINGDAFGYPAIKYVGAGLLVLDNCVFENIAGTALDMEPAGELELVIRNSRIIDSYSGGILLKPAVNGSIKATFDHVTVTGSLGGGIRADSTNGVVNLDLTDSEVSNNGGAGINAIAGASQNIVSIKNSVIARNGTVGVQANGANAGVLLQTTLLDQNASGATSIAGGGNMFTYGNNSIIGSTGSGFNHSAALQ